MSAATHHPALTTIHQPLRSMGQVAASTLLSLIRDEIPAPRPKAITVYPRLVVRKSTGHVGHHETAERAMVSIGEQAGRATTD